MNLPCSKPAAGFLPMADSAASRTVRIVAGSSSQAQMVTDRARVLLIAQTV